MGTTFKTQLLSFGFLRLSLISLSVLSMLLPLVEWAIIQMVGEVAERSALGLSAGLIAPVIAPVLVLVILLDIIIAKVRVADDSAGEAVLYKKIIQTETILFVTMLLFWIPFFAYMI